VCRADTPQELQRAYRIAEAWGGRIWGEGGCCLGVDLRSVRRSKRLAHRWRPATDFRIIEPLRRVGIRWSARFGFPAAALSTATRVIGANESQYEPHNSGRKNDESYAPHYQGAMGPAQANEQASNNKEAAEVEKGFGAKTSHACSVARLGVHNGVAGL